MSNLRDIRISKKFSQSQLSRKSGITISTIQHYEQDFKDINKASGIILYKLSRALGCTMQELLELDRIEIKGEENGL